MTAFRTPLKKVRGLGAAKGGTEHFIVQRVTAAANVLLIAFLVYAALSLVGASRAEVKEFFSQPWAAILGILLAISASIHMRIGMQVIIEDYVHGGTQGAPAAPEHVLLPFRGRGHFPGRDQALSRGVTDA